MLQIVVPQEEMWDEDKEEFVYTKSQVLQLEHSLVSISKWEEKWHKAFLGRQKKTSEESLDYIRCMTITQHVDPQVYFRLTEDNINDIIRYMDEPMTSVHFPKEYGSDENNRHSDVVTSEVIYYWMIVYHIPVEFRKWHLNKLLALIKVCELKSSPPKKRQKKDLYRDFRAINEANKKRFGLK